MTSTLDKYLPRATLETQLKPHLNTLSTSSPEPTTSALTLACRSIATHLTHLPPAPLTPSVPPLPPHSSSSSSSSSPPALPLPLAPPPSPTPFSRLHSRALRLLLATCGHSSADVRATAEESVHRIVKFHLPTDAPKILLEVYQVLKSAPPSPRTLRAALRCFSLMVHHVEPRKARTFAVSLLPTITGLVASPSTPDYVHETLSQVAQPLFTTFGPYFDAAPLEEFIAALLAKLSDPAEALRRSASHTISLLLLSRPDRLDASLVHILALLPHKEPTDAGTKPRSLSVLPNALLTEAESPEPVYRVLGGLHCLALLMDHIPSIPTDTPHIQRIVRLALDYLTDPDHNVVAMALEVLRRTVTFYCKAHPSSVTPPTPTVESWRTQRTVARCLSFIDRLLFEIPDVRVSLRALALSYLSELARFYPDDLLARFPLDSSPPLDPYPTHSDPLLRGNSALVYGALLRHNIRPDDLIPLLTGLLRDSSAQTRRLACVAVADCLPSLLDHGAASSAITLIRALLDMRTESYWVVKVELARTLALIDFDLVAFTTSFVSAAPAASLQDRTLDLFFDLIADPDARVRAEAAVSLAALCPRLCCRSARSPHALLHHVALVRALDGPDLRLADNVGVLVPRLLTLAATLHPSHVVQGAYRCLRLLDPAALRVFFTDIVSCTLNRCTTIITDPTAHTDVMLLLHGLTSLCGPDVVTSVSRIHLHVLRILSITGAILLGRPAPDPDADRGQSGLTPQEHHFINLHHLLAGVRQSTSSRLDQSSDDKFDNLCEASLTCLGATASYLARHSPGALSASSPDIVIALGIHSLHYTPSVARCVATLYDPPAAAAPSTAQQPSTGLLAIRARRPTAAPAPQPAPQPAVAEPTVAVSLTVPTPDPPKRRFSARLSRSRRGSSPPTSSPTSPSASSATTPLLLSLTILATDVLRLYSARLQPSLQSTLLKMCMRIVRTSGTLATVDPDNSLLGYIVEQITELSTHIPHPAAVLPTLFDLLGFLTFAKPYRPQILTSERIVSLVEAARPDWLVPLVPYITAHEFLHDLVVNAALHRPIASVELVAALVPSAPDRVLAAVLEELAVCDAPHRYLDVLLLANPPPETLVDFLLALDTTTLQNHLERIQLVLEFVCHTGASLPLKPGLVKFIQDQIVAYPLHATPTLQCCLHLAPSTPDLCAQPAVLDSLLALGTKGIGQVVSVCQIVGCLPPLQQALEWRPFLEFGQYASWREALIAHFGFLGFATVVADRPADSVGSLLEDAFFVDKLVLHAREAAVQRFVQTRLVPSPDDAARLVVFLDGWLASLWPVPAVTATRTLDLLVALPPRLDVASLLIRRFLRLWSVRKRATTVLDDTLSALTDVDVVLAARLMDDERTPPAAKQALARFVGDYDAADSDHNDGGDHSADAPTDDGDGPAAAATAPAILLNRLLLERTSMFASKRLWCLPILVGHLDDDALEALLVSPRLDFSLVAGCVSNLSLAAVTVRRFEPLLVRKIHALVGDEHASWHSRQGWQQAVAIADCACRWHRRFGQPVTDKVGDLVSFAESLQAGIVSRAIRGLVSPRDTLVVLDLSEVLIGASLELAKLDDIKRLARRMPSCVGRKISRITDLAEHHRIDDLYTAHIRTDPEPLLCDESLDGIHAVMRVIAKHGHGSVFDDLWQALHSVLEALLELGGGEEDLVCGLLQALTLMLVREFKTSSASYLASLRRSRRSTIGARPVHFLQTTERGRQLSAVRKIVDQAMARNLRGDLYSSHDDTADTPKELSPEVVNASQSFETLLVEAVSSPNTHRWVRTECARSLYQLSEYFRGEEQFAAMYTCFGRLVPSARDDPLLTRWLVAGICRSLSVLDVLPEGVPVDLDALLQESLQASSAACVRLSMLDGLPSLLDARRPRISSASLPTLYNEVLDALRDRSTAAGLQAKLLKVVFLLIVQFPKEAEELDFSKQAMQIVIRLCAERDTFLRVVAGVFRGLERLLVSFSLSHAQRDEIAKLAAFKFPASHRTRSLLQLGLFLACMYTGDEIKGQANDDIEGGGSNLLDTTEKVMDLFNKVRSGHAEDGEVVAQILPRVLVDFFPPDQVMSLVLGEFLNQKVNRDLGGIVLFEVASLLRAAGHQSTLTHWILICTPNFVQVNDLWSLTTLFLAGSPNSAVRSLFSGHGQGVVDADVFGVAARDFFESLQGADRDTFRAAVAGVQELQL